MADNYFNITASNNSAQYNLPLPPEQSGGGIQSATEYLISQKYYYSPQTQLYSGTLGDYFRKNTDVNTTAYYGNYSYFSRFNVQSYNQEIYQCVYIELNIPETSEGIGFYKYTFVPDTTGNIVSPVSEYSSITNNNYWWNTTSTIFNPGERLSWFWNYVENNTDMPSHTYLIIPSDETIPFTIAFSLSGFGIRCTYSIWKYDNGENTQYSVSDFCTNWADKVNLIMNMDYKMISMIPKPNDEELTPDFSISGVSTMSLDRPLDPYENKVWNTGKEVNKSFAEIFNIRRSIR